VHRAGVVKQYRITFIFEPHKAKARRLACDPCIVDGAKVFEQIAEVTAFSLRREVTHEHL
jgi:hypothetical protein